MTPTSTDCIPEQFQFKRVKSRQVIVNFQGGTVTSDAGLTLIADLDQKLKITSRLAECFQDYRQPNRVEHSLESLVAQRVYGLVQGYEDVNDHEQLRHDPMFALAVGKIIGEGTQPVVLAGKSTLNRLEHCPEKEINRQESRYHRIGHDITAIEKLFVEWFLESYSKVRGDSAYAREEIMEWCESQVGVDYVFGLSKNPRLMTMTRETQRQARVSYEHTLQAVENFLETLFPPEEEFQEVENLVLPCVLYRRFTLCSSRYDSD